MPVIKNEEIYSSFVTIPYLYTLQQNSKTPLRLLLHAFSELFDLINQSNPLHANPWTIKYCNTLAQHAPLVNDLILYKWSWLIRCIVVFPSWREFLSKNRNPLSFPSLIASLSTLQLIYTSFIWIKPQFYTL